MSDSIVVSKIGREKLFENVLVLSKAFVELASYAGKIDEDINSQSKDICRVASMVCASAALVLEYDCEEAMKMTKEIYSTKSNIVKKDKMSDLSIDDFLNTDA